MNHSRVLQILAVATVVVSSLVAQETSDSSSAAPAAQAASSTPPTPSPTDARAFGVLPNYRTAELSDPFRPITVKQKFTIARKDTFDWPSYFVAAWSAGIAQYNNTNPSFGQGMKGYMHRFGLAVVDQDVGNYLTEAVVPTLLHQDPRFFRKGTGSVGGRILYAASRVVVARNDQGRWGFNTAEFLGNGMVASLGNAYYPDNRGFSPTMQRMFTQIGTDALSQVLKEFWPDVKRKMAGKHSADGTP